MIIKKLSRFLFQPKPQLRLYCFYFFFFFCLPLISHKLSRLDIWYGFLIQIPRWMRIPMPPVAFSTTQWSFAVALVLFMSERCSITSEKMCKINTKTAWPFHDRWKKSVGEKGDRLMVRLTLNFSITDTNFY